MIADTSARLRIDRSTTATARWRLATETSAADALIAAAAQEVGADVLHYDRHFDRLAEVLNFQSLWLAPAGSLS
ncbi:PIN domain-containing protein [Conexibacter stalactiti]|uniref:PIN domain-containing protein n=1 Tax=Conexibacter stalactiti TaxID=1940611 RepID=A0ABU4HY15_9ACTN|nr:PIN domain-containing protein [Conexibacter stalactiti]MDW5598216.1 PIN domain-containing protein [Conexibacter stalactiti]MEC5038858.1 PIN domain-containing protein [Conexibacter stalactiti]